MQSAGTAKVAVETVCAAILIAALALWMAGCPKSADKPPVTDPTNPATTPASIPEPDNAAAQHAAPGEAKEGEMDEKVLEGKKVLMIISRQKFRDEELAEPRAVLEAAGAQVTIGCRSIQESVGMLGRVRVTPDLTLGDVVAADYDAVVFVGGSGSTEYWDDTAAHAIAKDAYAADKLVAAICMAPGTLANAGLLKGRKATAYSGAKSACVKGGCTWTGAGVESDGRIITADGPGSATEFGQVIRDALAAP